ncbi:MAG: oleate hydratase [Roseobacter sp.]|uniref:oleate hydratase n=1 Tax=Tateyamaria sp. TaxID=1929288 RepID=UPI00327EE2A5
MGQTEDSSKNAKVYLNGLGLGSISAAVYLVQKAGFDPANIHIFEQNPERDLVGGSMDASMKMVDGKPVYFMRGSRMYEDKVYCCTKELWSLIPYDEHGSCLDDHERNHEECQVDTVVRLLHADGEKDSGHDLGLGPIETVQMARLMATPESSIPDDAKITDYFSDAFFRSNYWYMWRALFAFQPWHSAVEMRRYMRLFFHRMSDMEKMTSLERTRYTNYHSFILPALRLLTEKGVQIHYNCRVTDADFKVDGTQRWIERLHLESSDGEVMDPIEVQPHDRAFLTIGSIVSNHAYGSHDQPVSMSPPEKPGGAYLLWQKLVAKQADLGRPERFLRDTSLSRMMHCTVTFRGSLFERKFQWLVERLMGRQSPLPLTHSPWILHLHTYRQPFYPGQAADTCVIWVSALGEDNEGQFVKKPMYECTGREILEEILGHLWGDLDGDEKAELLDTSYCVPCRLPYGISQFLPRAEGDRPPVIPEGSQNFALLGQFVEIPDGIVFTTEYSVLGAILAIKGLVNASIEPPAMYFGQHDPWTNLATAKAILR